MQVRVAEEMKALEDATLSFLGIHTAGLKQHAEWPHALLHHMLCSTTRSAPPHALLHML